ncbi:MAG: hypothetical protein CMP39_03435 [Rickettsiales bacterium]|nr:hypothetical protein [Rickettsiales bacterium]|tara:strand:+ start:4010 stop:4288 length:279 start_codon:yes stop_codon:yes gene_type:complete
MTNKTKHYLKKIKRKHFNRIALESSISTLQKQTFIVPIPVSISKQELDRHDSTSEGLEDLYQSSFSDNNSNRKQYSYKQGGSNGLFLFTWTA